MSVTLHVFVRESQLPTVAEWQHAIDHLGFPTWLDPSFDIRLHSGFWPARYRSIPTGFEFYLEPASDLVAECPHIGVELGDRDKCVTLRLGGDVREMCAALSAAASLAELRDGLHFSPEDNRLLGAGEAVIAARQNLEFADAGGYLRAR